MADSIQYSKNKLFTEDGIALIMVLWILALLVIIALNFAISNRWNSASTRNLKEETISYYMAVSGYHEAVDYIISDKDINVDFLDNEGNFWVDIENQPITGKRSTEEGEIDIRIIDEDAKININYATTEQLERLFEYAAIPQDSIIVIIDSMLDWKDSGDNDAHRLSGAENEYYESLEDPYKAKNALFDVPEELSLVKGMTAEYMYGSEETKSLIPLITTFGKGTININTVSQEVMEILGLNPFEIETVLKQRSKESGGWRLIPGEFSRYGLNTISSNNIRIEVTAKAKNSKIESKIVAVLNRKKTFDGYKIQRLYWRESAENIRG